MEGKNINESYHAGYTDLESPINLIVQWVSNKITQEF